MWLNSCSKEPQQLESFKLAFLVLLNVPIRTVVTETVTITGHLQLIYNSPCIASIVLNHIVIVLRNSKTDMKWPMINYMLLYTLALHIQYIHKHMQWKGWGYMAPATHTHNVQSISPSDLATFLYYCTYYIG